MDRIATHIRIEGFVVAVQTVGSAEQRVGDNIAAFMKNDILDAIILCNIENEHQLITFDNGLLEHMRKYKENRPTYKSSLELIEVFRKQ